MLAVCAGGLRTWLERHDALPDDPLVALIPVSIRTGEETDRWTNRVSMLSTVLPTDEPDSVERVRRVHDAMTDSKELFQAIPAEIVGLIWTCPCTSRLRQTTKRYSPS